MKKYMVLCIILLMFVCCDNPTINTDLPDVTTLKVYSIGYYSAICDACVPYFSTCTEKGVCWSTSFTPTIKDCKTINGGGIGCFSAQILGLLAGTTYYVCAYATNENGTNYGEILSFVTIENSLPQVNTAEIIEITSITAICGGNVTSDGGLDVTSRGVCWSTNQTPTILDYKTINGYGTGNFISEITGLSDQTKYYVRSYAINNIGIGYGKERSFVAHEVGTVTDIDGNLYRTVKIGEQWWMAENLKVTHYNNGDSIPNVKGNSIWENLTTGANCDYANNINNSNTYGKLYNWYSINDNRKIAPDGWRIPSLEDAQILIDYLGGEEVAGGKLKEAGFTHWLSPNTGATNESGFTALPGGLRIGDWYDHLTGWGYVWLSSSIDANSASSIWFFFNKEKTALAQDYKTFGISVRCIKNNK